MIRFNQHEQVWNSENDVWKGLECNGFTLDQTKSQEEGVKFARYKKEWLRGRVHEYV